jgi:hypothetical protein
VRHGGAETNRHPLVWAAWLLLALLQLALGLLIGLILFLLPAIHALGNERTALLAASAAGRLELSAPGIVLALVFVPIATRFGAWLSGGAGAGVLEIVPERWVKRVATAVAVLIASGAAAGAVLYVNGVSVYPVPGCCPY